MSRQEYHIFIDFDGTITQKDTLQMVLDRFAPANWWYIENDVIAGKRTDSEALQAEFDLVEADWDEVMRFLDDEVVIDPDFSSFVDYCSTNRLPLTILSGGFEEFIERILNNHIPQRRISFIANHIEIRNKRWKVIPNAGMKINGLCNHCKSYHLQQAKNFGKRVIYIGDGTTDRCPALRADIIFAKHHLADYLSAEKIAYYPFTGFADIRRQLKNLKVELCK